jgi:hypothetical protein
LARYGSFDPTPIYENRDYWSYFPAYIDPHTSIGANGRPVPQHNFGAPLLWLLPFIAWGRLGAHLVIVADGTLNPAPGNANRGDGLLQIPVHEGLLHLMLDGKFGLIPHFPIFALALPGFLIALRRGLIRVHLVLLATVLPYLLAISTFKIWWAGVSPPARFLAVVAPVLAYYVAVTLQCLRHWVMTLVAATTGLLAFAISLASDIHPRERFHSAVGHDQQTVFVAWAAGLTTFAVLVWIVGHRKPAPPVPDLPGPLFVRPGPRPTG